MFEQVFVLEAAGGKRFWTTCAGVTGQVALVAAMVLAPMVWPEALPHFQSFVNIIAPPGAPPPPPRASAAQPRHTAAVRPFVDPNGHMTQPTIIPRDVAMVIDEAPPVAGEYVVGGVPNGVANGVKDGVLGAILMIGNAALAPPRIAETPRAVEPPPAAPTIRTRLGGVVLAGKLISMVEPVYPQLARTMRVQGVVELMAVVGTDGRVRELKLVSGSPLLSPAAIEAVRRWVYRPTFLNGDPVEVSAPITVTFRLN
ncbi:MAG TPA: energy transducer TonB [Candidatus Sulfopaludibacter sp.]|jgi:protein TonB|nr:energy transducer TonB [Candidatus Sulfopaludibacter sp.]